MLKKDLEFHYFINAILFFKNKNSQEKKLDLTISIDELHNIVEKIQFSQVLYPDIYFEKDILELYLLKFNEYNILSVKSSTISVNFTSRSLLAVANRIYSKEQSLARIENEVFKFIRGSLVFDSSCVEGFKNATQRVKILYEQKTKILLTENELILQLIETFSSDQKMPEIIRAFIEVGFVKHLFSLERDSNNILTISGEGNIWFLLSSLFGLHVDMEGLPFLFYGTLPIYNPPGNNIFIRGGLGCGKSTLASQLAYEIADKGGVSIYLALEENIGILENLYASFGWTDNKEIKFEKIQLTENSSKDTLLNILNTYNDGDKGLFILANISITNFTDMFDLIDIICSDFLQELKSTTKIIVIDPINAVKVFHENLPEQQLRQSMVHCPF